MLLGHRRHRDHTSSRKDDYRAWNHESDSDRQRQHSGTPYRYDTDYAPTGHDRDRHHRSSKRVDAVNASLASQAARPASHRHASSAAVATTAYTTPAQPQLQTQAASAPPVVSSSRSRAHESARGAYDMQAHLQRRTDRRSPRSSEERVYATDPGAATRHAAPPPRPTYPTTSAPQASVPSQAYWAPAPPHNASRDPTSSSRHHRDRDKERDRDRDRDREPETKEQRRERRAREKAAREEHERMMAAAVRQSDWPKERPTTAESTTDAERAKEYVSDKERDLERQRRREERARRREEREQEREREQRKEEERARRHREKERPPKDRDGRTTKDDNLQYYAVYPQLPTKHTSTVPSSRHRGDDRSSTRHGPFLTDQIPSSSSNVALPLHAQQSPLPRPEGVVVPPNPSPVPPQVPEKDRRHRSHRERALIQQAGQESGVSSSEQEITAKERKSHRRRAQEADGDAHPSGPSGSETERIAEKERRRAAQAAGDSFYAYPNRSKEGRQPSVSYAQIQAQAPASGAVPSVLQTTAPVGPLRSQHHAPQIVSIRAGQGPTDPQTPLLRTKTPSAAPQSRSREQPVTAAQVQPAATAPGYGTQPQPQNTSQTSFRQEGPPSQAHPAPQASSRAAAPPPTQDASRAQASQASQTYYSHTAPTYAQPQQQVAPAQYLVGNAQVPTANGPGSYSAQAPTYPVQGPATYQPSPTGVGAVAPNHSNGNPHTHTSYQGAASTQTQIQQMQTSTAAPESVSRAHVPSIPAKTLQPLPVSKSRSGSSLRKVADAHSQIQAQAGQPPANVARLSVYHSPGPAISADLLLPVAVNKSQRSSGGGSGDANLSAKTPRAPTQDLAARFPLHEDMLTSASSSTLAPGTGRSAANILPGHAQHYMDMAHQASTANTMPARSSQYAPLLDNAPAMPGAYEAGTPLKHSAQGLRVENDVPIPIPTPKTNRSSQDVSTYQIPGQQQPYPSRPQPNPVQSKAAGVSTASAYAAAMSSASSKYAQQSVSQAPNGMLSVGLPGTTGTTGTTASHSPRRKTSQQTLRRSPSVHLAPPPGSMTPKHSPSVPRNGSTDTIQHITVKSSPNDPYRPLGQRNSNGSLRAPQYQLSSRPPNETHKSLGQRNSDGSLRAPQARASPRTANDPYRPLGQRNSNSSLRAPQLQPSSRTPNDPYRTLAHRTSNGSFRVPQPQLQPQPSSRHDTKPSRTQPTTEYPDPRYRSTTSTAYPTSAPPTHSNYPANTTNHAHAHGPSSTTHHSRSTSQPVNSSNSYDHQTSAQRSHTAMVTPSPAAASSAAALAAAYRSGAYSSEHPVRTQEPASQRAPPRAAPSPAPSINGRPYAPAPSMLSKSGFATAAPPAQPVRSQTHPTPSRPPGAPASVSHNRSVSDPQFARVAVSGHPSTPAPAKVQLNLPSSPSEQELLKTPSSIARSVSKGSHLPPPTTSRTTPGQSTKSSKDRDSKVKSIFGFFRSRSSPPKEEAVISAATIPAKTRQRSTSQTTLTAVAASVRNIVAPHPAPSRHHTSSRSANTSAQTQEPSAANGAPSRSDRRRMAPQHTEVTAPAPVQAVDHSAQMGQGPSKTFTPFRLLSRKHRAVSEASVEAQDGTATNTMIGGESARSSTAGRITPELRDPIEATRSWRNREEQAHEDRGTWRRRRPGVVFDLEDEYTDTETYNPMRKPGRRS